MREVEDHPNAVRLLEVYEEAHAYYLVMESCDGGELFDHISNAKVRGAGGEGQSPRVLWNAAMRGELV